MAVKAIFKDQATLRKVISQRIYVDITRTAKHTPKRGTKTLNGVFHDATERLSKVIVAKATVEFAAIAKKEYIDSLDAIAEVYNDGIPTTAAFPKFSKKYASRKRTADKRRGRGRKTANKFFVKERGGANATSDWLYTEFKRFSKGYKQSIRNTKGVIVIHGSKPIYRGNRHRISMDIDMPVPKIGGQYLKELLVDSFFKRKIYTETSRENASNSLPSGLKKLAWLEVGPPGVPAAKGRPFISRKQQKAGMKFRATLDKYMVILLKDAEAKGLIGFK